MSTGWYVFLGIIVYAIYSWLDDRKKTKESIEQLKVDIDSLQEAIDEKEKQIKYFQKYEAFSKFRGFYDYK